MMGQRIGTSWLHCATGKHAGGGVVGRMAKRMDWSPSDEAMMSDVPMSMSTHAAGNLDLAWTSSWIWRGWKRDTGNFLCPVSVQCAASNQSQKGGAYLEWAVLSSYRSGRDDGSRDEELEQRRPHDVDGSISELERCCSWACAGASSTEASLAPRVTAGRDPSFNPPRPGVDWGLSNHFHTPGMQKLARHGQWMDNSSVVQKKKQPPNSTSPLIPSDMPSPTRHGTTWNNSAELGCPSVARGLFRVAIAQRQRLKSAPDRPNPSSVRPFVGPRRNTDSRTGRGLPQPPD